MDDLLLALFQWPQFAIEGPLLVLLALIFGGYIVHALWTGRIGSDEHRIVRAEQPRRFARAILASAAFVLFWLAIAAFAFLRPEEFRRGVPVATPLIWILLIPASLYQGVAFSFSRAEQPRLFWCAIAFMVLMLAMTLRYALEELGAGTVT